MQKKTSAFIVLISICFMALISSCDGSKSSGNNKDSSTEELPVLIFSAQQFVENAGDISIVVSLSKSAVSAAIIDYQFSDDSAVNGTDYNASSGQLSFSSGELEKTIPVLLMADSVKEKNERFFVNFSNPDNLQLDQTVLTIDIIESWMNTSEFDPHWGEKGIFTNAALCGECHSGATDTSGVLRYPKQTDGEDISPKASWQHSVMSHGFNDPYYRAKVQDEITQFPSLAGTIEDKCLTCHTPMAHHHAHTTGMLSTEACLSGEGCYRMEQADADMMARESISCTLCHQINAADAGNVFSGGFEIQTDAKTIYGPYGDSPKNPMENNTQYTVAGSAHVQGSGLCATCHNVKTPSVNVTTDQLTGRYFVEQSPYTEWLNSTFNDGDSEDKQCQDCHMPRIDGYSSQVATQRSGSANTSWPERDEYSQHYFLGGNNYLLELLKVYRSELGIINTTSEQGFDSQINRNKQFLSEAADISIESIALNNDQLDVAVKVSNKTGHKLPTGFPSRRVWVNLMIKDSSDTVLFESGTPDDKGFLAHDAAQSSEACVKAKKTADYDASVCLMPHYDEINTSSQIAIYESVMGDTNHQVSYVLLYGDEYLKDNRIPPEGFSSLSSEYSSETAIVGGATSDSDFNKVGNAEGSGSDVVHYTLDWASKANTGLQFEAKLYYQSIRPGFVSGFQHSGDKINRFKGMYNSIKPEAIQLGQDAEIYP